MAKQCFLAFVGLCDFSYMFMVLVALVVLTVVAFGIFLGYCEGRRSFPYGVQFVLLAICGFDYGVWWCISLFWWLLLVV